MSYATLMVHCSLTTSCDNRLTIAASLAERFDARVIGIAAHAVPVQLYFAEGDAAAYAEEQDLANIEKYLRLAEERFHKALKGHATAMEWRSAIEAPQSFIAKECRAADLVIIGQNDEYPSLDPGDLAMQTGRPLLMVPQEVETLKAERILIAWKDTREARRAICDALPLLRLCQKAIVVEIDEARDPVAAARRVEDVAAWLAGHGVNAAGWSEPLRKDASAQLDALATEEVLDLVVAGAYGHGKFREWVFGGVTRALLRQTSRCHLLAH